MKRIALLVMPAVLLMANESDQALKVEGTFKTYHIHTLKAGSKSSNAWANSIGGQLAVTTSRWNNIYAKVNFMTTNGVFLPEIVDGSVLSNNMAMYDGGSKGRSFTVIGESYAAYTYDTLSLKLGAQIINSPLADAKEVRVLPSTFNAATLAYKSDAFDLGLSYIDGFKERTSDRFFNILEHALGSKTTTYTGMSSGAMIEGHVKYAKDAFAAQVYEYYMPNFINSIYAQADLKMGELTLNTQLITQQSVGNFHTNLQNGTTIDNTAYTSGVNTLNGGFKASYKVEKTLISVSSTATLNFTNSLSDVIAVYDGTPLFTDTITGNNLFKSWYGHGLDRADAGYKAGTLGYQLKVKHNWLDTLSTMLSATQYRQNFSVAQTDLNAEISYTYEKWDIALKGIWVFDNDEVIGNSLHQYRVIITRPFS